jgi:hypothetical protein
MKINEVTEVAIDPKRSNYANNKYSDANKYGQRMQRMIDKDAVEAGFVLDDELWGKVSSLGSMLSEIPDGLAKTPQEAIQKSRMSKEEMAKVGSMMAKFEKWEKSKPTAQADEPEDDEFAAPSDDEIARQADRAARG